MVGIASGDESANGQTSVNEAAAISADSSSVSNSSPSVSAVTGPSNQEQPQAKLMAPKPR